MLFSKRHYEWLGRFCAMVEREVLAGEAVTDFLADELSDASPVFDHARFLLFVAKEKAKL